MTKRHCTWTGCGKAFKPSTHAPFADCCGTHHRLSYRVLMHMCSVEGPLCLSRGNPTTAELAEFHTTGLIPTSRDYQPTFENSHIKCADCGGGLVMIANPAYKNTGFAGQPPRAIRICRNCSFAHAEAS